MIPAEGDIKRAGCNSTCVSGVAGVHFVPATKAGRTLCEPIGRAAYARGKALIDGTDTGPVDINNYF